MPPRRIYDHEFVYVMRGQGEIIIDGQIHAAWPDSLFLIQPRQWHFFRALPAESLTLLGVHFDWIKQDDFMPRFRPVDDPIDEQLFRVPCGVPHWNLPGQPFLNLKGRPRVRRLLEETVMEYGRADAIAQSGAGALLAAAIAHMAREAQWLEKLPSLAHIGPDALRRVERARIFLEVASEVPVTIADAAAHVGWSADHLRRMFRSVLNTSPQQIHSAARIRRAKELLRYEHLPIHKIAEQCGFADASHFARVFKQECGVTPREFLALMKE